MLALQAFEMGYSPGKHRKKGLEEKEY